MGKTEKILAAMGAKVAYFETCGEGGFHGLATKVTIGEVEVYGFNAGDALDRLRALGARLVALNPSDD